MAKNKKPKFDLKVNTQEYKNSNKFDMEKKYDYAKYYIPRSSLLAEFEKDYSTYVNLLNEYEKSNLAYAKNIVKEGKYSSKDENKILKNTMQVEFEIIKRKKTKKITELKVNDDLVNYIALKRSLKFYEKKLMDHKKHKDYGKYNFLMFEAGTEYSNAKEFRNLKMLIETTSNSIKTMENSENLNSQEIKTANNWNEFLKNNIEIEVTHGDYGAFVFKSIDVLPEFNKPELNEISKFNNYFEQLIKDNYKYSAPTTNKTNNTKNKHNEAQQEEELER